MGEENFLLPQQRNRSKGNTTWYGGVTKNGATKWVSLKTRSQKKAMDWYNEKQAVRYLPKESKPVALKIGDAAKAYLEDICKVRRRAKGTIKEYEQPITQRSRNKSGANANASRKCNLDVKHLRAFTPKRPREGARKTMKKIKVNLSYLLKHAAGNRKTNARLTALLKGGKQ